MNMPTVPAFHGASPASPYGNGDTTLEDGRQLRHTGDGLGRVERALGAILVEETTAGCVDEVAVRTPPGVHREALVLAAQIGDLGGDVGERRPVPLTGCGECTRVVGAGLGDQVVVEVQRERRHVAGQAPQLVAGCAGLGVERHVVHRLGVELVGVEAVCCCQRCQVVEQSGALEAGDVGAGDPEHIGRRAVGDLGDQLVLVVGGVGGAGLVASSVTASPLAASIVSLISP